MVLLSWSADAPPTTTDTVAAELRRLPGLIGEIRSYEVVTDAGLADGNADLAVIATFDSPAGFRAYSTHPEHVRVIEELIRPHLSSRSALQHELTGQELR